MSTTTAPDALPVRPELIPQALASRDCWVAWQYHLTDGSAGPKWTKLPLNPRGGLASVDDPTTWGTLTGALEFARRHGRPGVGYVIGDDSPFSVIDLDDVFGEGGVLSPAVACVTGVPSYWERSPGGTGLRGVVEGKLPPGRRKRGGVEMYDRRRYFTVTGHRLDCSTADVRACPGELAVWHARLLQSPDGEPPPPPPREGPPPRPTTLADRELIARIEASQQGPKFRRLMAGDTSLHGGDDSAADLALCDILAFWCGGDAARMDSLFRTSGLMRPKWDDRRPGGTYGSNTIAKALEGRSAFWEKAPVVAHVRYGNDAGTKDGPPPGDDSSEPPPPPPPGWPRPLGEAAYHGLAGRVVRAMEPYTEADPAGVLVQVLVAAGNLLGRNCWYAVGNRRHYPNLFAALVGGTGRSGRKGTSWAEVVGLVSAVSADYATARVASGGLVSGEGLVQQVRDPLVKDGESVDAGESDKRFLCVDEEFGRLLQVCRREGNSLSQVLREAWDSGSLRVMGRQNPLRASGAHVSLVGHVTSVELHATRRDVDVHNGLFNRFLWCCVRRSKRLPICRPAPDMPLLADDLAASVAWAAGDRRLDWSADAESAWCDWYTSLADEPGVLGLVTNRAEAQVVRLALLYATLDRSPAIDTPHLSAALEVWRYCRDSAAYLFGDGLGDPLVDRVDDALQTAFPAGMTRSELYLFFQKHRRSSEIEAAVESLISYGRARREVEKAPGRRDVHRYFSTVAPDHD